MIKIYKNTKIQYLKTCPRCKRVFSPKQQLRDYIPGKKMYECPECGTGIKV